MMQAGQHQGPPAAFDDVARVIRADADLWSDFMALCDHGGRMAGSDSERAAQDWAAARLAAGGGEVRREPTAYAGWRCDRAALFSLPDGEALQAVPLLGTAFTPAGGLELPVLDLGRGTPEMIAQAGEAVRGRAVMVAHEYPFSTRTVHRRVKLAAAQRAGAAAFLVAQPEAGVGPVSGSSGRGGGPGIPAMGVSAEAAAHLRQAGARVRMHIDGADLPGAQTDTLVLDLPGGDPASPERVVLSAHLDGHPLAESALDNGTGLVAALALARAFAPRMARMRRGLTVCLFSAEEWALNGSREWLAALPAERRDRMALNINLDSLDGSPRLTALTSGFPRLGAFAQQGARHARAPLGVHLPLMSNSDHANFAAVGIPALRLIAGFDEPDSALRLLLTPADTRALADPSRLKAATLTAAGVLWHALTAEDLSSLRERDAEAA